MSWWYCRVDSQRVCWNSALTYFKSAKCFVYRTKVTTGLETRKYYSNSERQIHYWNQQASQTYITHSDAVQNRLSLCCWSLCIPAILSVIDRSQCGGIPRSSATLVLINIVREWAEATDGTGDAVRVVLFDYLKAFDLIDHRILARKVFQPCIPLSVKKWIANFLMNGWWNCPEIASRDGVAIARNSAPGCWCGKSMILHHLSLKIWKNWKYIDDTTISDS